MISIDSPVEWQVRDEIYPTLKAWYTHPALEEIKKWDVSGKNILEYGGGWSSIWWAFYAKEVVTIETDWAWIEDIMNYLGSIGWSVSGEMLVSGNGETILNKYVAQHLDLNKKLTMYYRPTNEGDQTKIEYYTNVPDGFVPDIVIVDGVLRYECIQKALTLPRPITLIVDNFMQAFVFMCPSAVEILKPFKGELYEQTDHTNNDGVNKWKTGIWNIK